MDLIEKDDHKWSYDLHASEVVIESLGHKQLITLREDPIYDTELLPSLFTFREILWQPDVFTDSKSSLPGLRILKAYCEETASILQEGENVVGAVYEKLILGLAGNCKEAIESIETKKNKEEVAMVLGGFRTKSFPIIKFFIYHPRNRKDYFKDAVNRLNYAVKVILTEFHGRYTSLEDPYWEVKYAKSKTVPKKPVKEKSSKT